MDLLKKHRYSTYVSIIRTCFSHHTGNVHNHRVQDVALDYECLMHG